MIEAAATANVPDAGVDRLLNQDEIDNLLGFANEEAILSNRTGLRAIVDSAMVSYERLPMLEIVFDRLVRLLTTSLRNFFSDNVEVSLSDITSVRFGDYINSIPLPTILAVFRAEEWDNFGLITVDSTLAYSVIDVLLGGRRASTAARLDGRPYSTIETSLVRRMLDLVLADTRARLQAAVAGALQHRPDRDQSALRLHLASRQRRHPDPAPDRHGRPRRLGRDPAALRHHRAHPRAAAAELHGREVRPRSDLGGPSRDRDLAGQGRRSTRSCTRPSCRCGRCWS